MIKKVKNTVSWTYVVSDLSSEEIVGKFYKKSLKKTNQKKFRVEKVIQKKWMTYKSNGKIMIILLTVQFIKKNYFLEPYTRCKNKIKIELELYNKI